jgi:phosphate transport system substrate-binding protein
MCAAVPAGCSEQQTPAGPQEKLPVVRLSGSGVATPLLRQLTDAYDGAEIEWQYLSGFHTAAAVEGVSNGEFEIGGVSRELTEEEKATGLNYTFLATDAVAIVVHPSAAIEDLTTAQVRGIYSGDYANWQELGGADVPITVLDRNEGDSGKLVMRQYVFGQDLVITPDAAVLYYQDDMVDGVQSTAGAIGYFSYGYGLSRAVPVSYVALDGVAPTVENVSNGTYPLLRPVGVVISSEASPEVAAFLEWTTSREAAEIMRANGYAPR